MACNTGFWHPNNVLFVVGSLVAADARLMQDLSAVANQVNLRSFVFGDGANIEKLKNDAVFHKAQVYVFYHKNIIVIPDVAQRRSGIQGDS